MPSKTIQCEACGSSRVRASHHADPIDKIRGQSGQVPWRCRDCRIRFYCAPVTAEPPVTRRRPHRRGIRTILKRRRRALISSGIFLLLLGLFLTCLAYLTHDHGDDQTRLIYPPAELSS
jgi:hypothetical protein